MKSILFKPDMIKAIVSGTKTQTRRVIKPQPHNEKGVMRWQPLKGIDINMEHLNPSLINSYAKYKVGEVVYIKEAYWQDQSGGLWDYKYDISRGENIEWPVTICGGKAVSPLFMPAWAARYFITITDVWAERLREITEEDAIREGCQLIARTIQPLELKPIPHFTAPERPFTHRDHFIGIWDSINNDYQWELNPFVWVYSFEKVDKRVGIQI